jgi:CRP-like cAMP-binding protein
MDNDMPDNLLLASLPDDVRERLEPSLECVHLPREFYFYDGHKAAKAIYFPAGGLASMVAMSQEGDMVEGTMVGITGLVGLPAVLAKGFSHHLTLVQVPGPFLKIAKDDFLLEFDRGGALQQATLGFALQIIDEIAQTALCNRMHNLGERLARWLLMARDAIESDTLPLTQEFISYMLGVRRSGVTVAASALQEEGSINYTRGRIQIIDGQKLAESACSCYGALKR